MHCGNAAAMPDVRNEATFSFCHGSRSLRITTAILVSNCMEPPVSFRDGPKDQTADVQLHIGESRDSPMRNCALGFAATRRPGMTSSVALSPAAQLQAPAA